MDNKIQTISLNSKITLDKQLLRSIKKELQKATNTIITLSLDVLYALKYLNLF